jgi:hypothetical protein
MCLLDFVAIFVIIYLSQTRFNTYPRKGSVWVFDSIGPLLIAQLQLIFCLFGLLRRVLLCRTASMGRKAPSASFFAHYFASLTPNKQNMSFSFAFSISFIKALLACYGAYCFVELHRWDARPHLLRSPRTTLPRLRQTSKI